jgi:hypothetical protein
MSKMPGGRFARPDPAKGSITHALRRRPSFQASLALIEE